MIKRILIGNMCLILAVACSAFAQQGQQGSQPEEISITTYYPSPYGSYHELSTDRLSVGADNDPAADGVINFKNLSSDPASGHIGALYYNSATDKFKYYNGSQWQNVGGEEGIVWFGNMGVHLKDGASANASCKASSITWVGSSRNVRGTIQTMASVSEMGPPSCNTGYQNGYNAQCSIVTGPWTCTGSATTIATEVKISGICDWGMNHFECSAESPWQ